jgi:KDO2-lipid IV(A) lauroyltransferase
MVDWGYRSDGIPVRLFGRWTTLPAGPATLAARTGASILPVSGRRSESGQYVLSHEPRIEVAGADPASLQRATQAIADALERAIRAAPDQWHNFKPMWPETADEEASLERRAAAMLAGRGPVESSVDTIRSTDADAA